MSNPGKLGRDVTMKTSGAAPAKRSDMPAVRPPSSARSVLSSAEGQGGAAVRGNSRTPQASVENLAPIKRPPSRSTKKSILAMSAHVVSKVGASAPAKYYNGAGPKRELSRRGRGKPPAQAWGELLAPSGAEGAPLPIATPTFSQASARGRSAPAKAGRRAPSERPYRGEKGEKCGRCVREAVWAACDVFWTFDQTFSGEISRTQYSSSLSEAPTVERLRMLRKSQLDMRFRRSARPVTLEEFLCMIWPGALDEDLALMRQWARLREAHAVAHTPNFRAGEADVRRVFELLLPAETQEQEVEGVCLAFPAPRVVPVGELVRSQLIPRKEALAMMQGHGNDKAHQGDLHQMLSLEVFRAAVQPVLKQMYVTQDVLKRMKQEEDMSLTNNLESMFIKTK